MDPAAREYVITRTPMNRTGRAEEIAAAVLFLCFPGASYVNGAIREYLNCLLSLCDV